MSDWWTSRWPTDAVPPYFAPEDIQAMTHQPEQSLSSAMAASPSLQNSSNLIDDLKRFYQGGLSEVLKGTGYQLPDWSNQIGNTLQSEAANIAMGMTVPLKRPSITAFHGSPHDFDRFDLSRIGTGEARLDPNLPVSQRQVGAYGAGLYFAENPKVAEEYNNQFNRNPGSEADAKMYQVSIKADPEHFLDWDKPLSEQSEKVQKALAPWDNPVSRSAGEVYQYARYNPGKLGDIDAKLREAGIPGIKYLDQGSRPSSAAMGLLENDVAYLEELVKSRPNQMPKLEQARERLAQATNAQTRNYVLFDDKLIDIIKKYGLAGLLGPAAASYFPAPGVQPQ